MLAIRQAKDRGHANHGWLDAHHTFSFADYHDPNWMGYRSLRVLNDDTIAGGGGFGTHPHRDMEIITYIIRGSLEHRDSMGNGRVIHSGDVQYMAAGTGVQHSEFNHSRSDPVRLLQIWIVPNRKGAPPNYAERSFADAITGTWHLVTSQSGRDQSIPINQDVDTYLAKLKAGETIRHSLRLDRHAWIQVATGSIRLNGTILTQGDGAAVSNESAIELIGLDSSEVLLFELT